MTSTKLKLLTLGALVALGLGTSVIIQQHRLSLSLRDTELLAARMTSEVAPPIAGNPGSSAQTNSAAHSREQETLDAPKLNGIEIQNAGLTTPQSATSTLFWSILNDQAEVMGNLLAKDPEGTPSPPPDGLEESLKRQKDHLTGVIDIRLREAGVTSDENVTLAYDLVRSDNESNTSAPTQVELHFQKQGNEWKLARSAWRRLPRATGQTPDRSSKVENH